MLVVPLVGTWIEIDKQRKIICKLLVVPLVGTWIEIDQDFYNGEFWLSFPLWERGLK